MSQVRQPADTGFTTLVAVGALILLLLWANKLIYVSCMCLYWIWRFWADFWFSITGPGEMVSQAAAYINLLARTGNNAESVSLSEWADVMNQTSVILLIFLLPLVVCGAISMLTHPSLPFRSRRVINIHTLPYIFARFSPAIIPVLAASQSKDLLMNDTRPEYRWALRPEEFAGDHNLVRARMLDRDKARAVFTAQLGPEITDKADGLQDYEKALFAVFGRQVFFNDRKRAKKLLDRLNISCMDKRTKGLLRPAFALTDADFRQVWDCAEMKTLRKTHRYVRTALAGLAGRDIHLPPSQFHWLKAIDRTLWYALHSADTHSVFIEGAGVLAQMRAERLIAREKLDFREVWVEKAIDGLEQDLQTLGLLHREPPPKPKKKEEKPEWKPATLSNDAWLPDETDIAEDGLQMASGETDDTRQPDSDAQDPREDDNDTPDRASNEPDTVSEQTDNTPSGSPFSLQQ